MSEGRTHTTTLDWLPGLIIESFEQALSGSDYLIAFRLLKTLEKYLIKDGVAVEQRIEAVALLVDYHRRLMEQSISCGGLVLPMPNSDQFPTTRH